MMRRVLGIAAVLALFPVVGSAEVRQVRQDIFGMD